MDLSTVSLAANVLLGLGLLYVAYRLSWTKSHIADLRKDAAFAAGYEQGRRELLDSVRYEREIHECRRVGVFRKETELKIRERVMLGNLRIAESDRAIVLSSEVDPENIWNLVEQAGQHLITPQMGSIVRTISPGVQRLLALKK